MSGQFTLWGAGELLNSFFGRGAFPPEEFWLALVVGEEPTPYLLGEELDEPDPESGYQRILIANDTLSWSNDGLINVTANTETLTFVDALDDWGIIRYWAVCDAMEEGNVYLVGNLEAPENVLAGDVVELDPGVLRVSIGPFFLEE